MTRVRLSRYRELARVAEATGFQWMSITGSWTSEAESEVQL